MIRTTHAARGAALVGALALALSACSSSSSTTSPSSGGSAAAGSGDALVIGTLLPQTGSLAFLGPPEIAGVNLAIKDINDAGGVMGKPVVVEHADSSDADASCGTATVVGRSRSSGWEPAAGVTSLSVTVHSLVPSSHGRESPRRSALTRDDGAAGSRWVAHPERDTRHRVGSD